MAVRVVRARAIRKYFSVHIILYGISPYLTYINKTEAWKIDLHMRSPPEEPHLAAQLVTFSLFFGDLLWPFMVIGQIYGISNFRHNFCQLALLGKYMNKI